MSPPLADPADFADFIARPLASIDVGRAALLLELASDLVRGELRQKVHAVDDDEVMLLARGGRVLALPELPVRAVTRVAVVERGTTTELVDDVDYLLEPDVGLLHRIGGRSWPGLDGALPARVLVTYDHGYPTGEVPGGLVVVVMRVAARGFVNPTSLRQESVNAYSSTMGASNDSPGLYLTAGDEYDLGPYYPGSRQGARA